MADAAHQITTERWLQRYHLEPISEANRAALSGFARDIKAARTMLETSKAITWRGVWEKQPKRPANHTPSVVGGSTTAARSGANQRKREPYVPTVMRDDYVPGEISAAAKANPPQPKRKRRAPASPPVKDRELVRLKVLKPAEVDPDFKGTPLEFTAKYGHVLIQTKQQIEYHKRQEELMAWLGLVTDHAKTARALTVVADPETLREWMAKPAKAEKLRAWCDSIERACKNIGEIVAMARPVS